MNLHLGRRPGDGAPDVTNTGVATILWRALTR